MQAPIKKFVKRAFRTLFSLAGLQYDEDAASTADAREFATIRPLIAEMMGNLGTLQLFEQFPFLRLLRRLGLLGDMPSRARAAAKVRAGRQKVLQVVRRRVLEHQERRATAGGDYAEPPRDVTDAMLDELALARIGKRAPITGWFIRADLF